MKNNPLVSVITPTYNRAAYLPETIESVLSQDYPNIEYIVLDDGSQDNTLEILGKYGDKIMVEAHANMGETETVNKGFRMAKGEFICVVNSDDPLLPGAITRMVSMILNEPNVLAVYPDWLEIDPFSKPIREMKLPDYDIFNMINDFNVAMGPGSIFRRAVLEEYGFRDTKRRYTGDLEFWFRLALHGKLLHVPETLATHRIHPHSTSVSDMGSKMAEELMSIVESLIAPGILPKEIQNKKNQILSHAYQIAIFYCRNEPANKLKYALLSFRYDPYRGIVSSVATFPQFVVSSTFAFLRAVLPEQSYNLLRTWWRGLKKTNIV